MGNLQCSFNYGYQHSGKRYFPKDGLNEVCAVRKFKRKFKRIGDKKTHPRLWRVGF